MKHLIDIRDSVYYGKCGKCALIMITFEKGILSRHVPILSDLAALLANAYTKFHNLLFRIL